MPRNTVSTTSSRLRPSTARWKPMPKRGIHWQSQLALASVAARTRSIPAVRDPKPHGEHELGARPAASDSAPARRGAAPRAASQASRPPTSGMAISQTQDHSNTARPRTKTAPDDHARGVPAQLAGLGQARGPVPGAAQRGGHAVVKRGRRRRRGSTRRESRRTAARRAGRRASRSPSRRPRAAQRRARAVPLRAGRCDALAARNEDHVGNEDARRARHGRGELEPRGPRSR